MTAPSIIAAAALCLPLAGCVSFSDLTIAPLPCQPQIFPVERADLSISYAPDGWCLRGKIKDTSNEH